MDVMIEVCDAGSGGILWHMCGWVGVCVCVCVCVCGCVCGGVGGCGCGCGSPPACTFSRAYARVCTSGRMLSGAMPPPAAARPPPYSTPLRPPPSPAPPSERACMRAKKKPRRLESTDKTYVWGMWGLGLGGVGWVCPIHTSTGAMYVSNDDKTRELKISTNSQRRQAFHLALHKLTTNSTTNSPRTRSREQGGCLRRQTLHPALPSPRQ